MTTTLHNIEDWPYMTIRGKIFSMAKDEVGHVVIHFVWKEQWSEVRIFRFMGSVQLPGREATRSDTRSSELKTCE